MRIDLRIAQDRRHPILEPLGNEVFQTLSLFMHLIPRVFQDIMQEQLE